MAQMCAAMLAGDLTTARRINRSLLPLHLGLFCEANPIPVKWALQRMGRIPGGIRLPMTPLAETNHPAMVRILSQSGVLA